MAAPLNTCATIEQRGVVRLLSAKNMDAAKDIHKEMLPIWALFLFLSFSDQHLESIFLCSFQAIACLRIVTSQYWQHLVVPATRATLIKCPTAIYVAVYKAPHAVYTVAAKHCVCKLNDAGFFETRDYQKTRVIRG
jgi:hypothetical protein